MRLFQHLEGSVCRAARGRELVCRLSFWYIEVRRTRYVIIFTKFISRQQKCLVQIKILIHAFIIFRGRTGKTVNFEISDEKISRVNLKLINEI
jgi:hypothetical protein